MKRLIMVLLLCFSPAWANATVVTIDGLDWQQLTLFNSAGGVSWNDLSNVCNVTTGVGTDKLTG